MGEPEVMRAFVEVLPGPIGAAILARLATSFAGRAGFGMDHTAELLRVTDAIAGSDPVRSAEMARVAFTARPGEVSLTIGPLVDPASLVHAPAGSPLDLAPLTEAETKQDGTGYMVCVRVRG
jgi:hypothetical protein